MGAVDHVVLGAGAVGMAIAERVWHLPSPETRTTRDVVALVYQAAGTKPRLKVTPAWQMRALGLVNGTVETELGLRATPLADAVERTVRWYRAQQNPSPAAHDGGTRHVAPGLEPN